jgi:hypothetical protein
LTWIPAISVAGSQSDIHHLARGYEVHQILILPLWPADQLAKELLDRRSQHSLLVARIHAMAVQLDEEPLGTSMDSDRCLLPESKTFHCGRVSCCQLAILNAWKWPSAFSPTKIEHERPLDHQGEDLRRPTALQIPASAVGRRLIQGRPAFVQGIDLAHLRRGRCRGKSEIGIAASLGKNVHLIVYSTEASLG